MSGAKFRVALSSDFLTDKGTKSDGKLDLKFGSFDLCPLEDHPDVELVLAQVEAGRVPASAVNDVDALILLGAKFDKDSIPAAGSRLAIVARFGVGFDTVDVAACTAAGIAVTITPDGVRRPVAVAILTFILALSTKLIPKNRLTRLGADGFAQRAQYMGVGLEGLTLGSIGIGNIGGEMFRISKPLGMNYLAYDPFADEATAAALGVTLDVHSTTSLSPPHSTPSPCR
jgi:D-3-phosphoglycerate dehydrogenase